MVDVPPLISPRAQGAVSVASRRGQDRLKAGGSFFSRTVQWLSGRLPGSSRRVRRANDAVRRFIQDRQSAGFSSSTIDQAIDAYTSPNRPITARQIRQITLHLENITSKADYIDYAALTTRAWKSVGQLDSLGEKIQALNPRSLAAEKVETLLAERPGIEGQLRTMIEDLTRVTGGADRVLRAMEKEGYSEKQIAEGPLKTALDGLRHIAKPLRALSANLTWTKGGTKGGTKGAARGEAGPTPPGSSGKKVHFAPLPEGKSDGISSPVLSEAESAHRRTSIEDTLRSVTKIADGSLAKTRRRGGI